MKNILSLCSPQTLFQSFNQKAIDFRMIEPEMLKLTNFLSFGLRKNQSEPTLTDSG